MLERGVNCGHHAPGARRALNTSLFAGHAHRYPGLASPASHPAFPVGDLLPGDWVSDTSTISGSCASHYARGRCAPVPAFQSAAPTERYRCCVFNWRLIKGFHDLPHPHSGNGCRSWIIGASFAFRASSHSLVLPGEGSIPHQNCFR